MVSFEPAQVYEVTILTINDPDGTNFNLNIRNPDTYSSTNIEIPTNATAE
jgi:hypothetical protein